MNVVFIIVDSLQASAPGFAGGCCNTPCLDRLAAEGTRFEKTFVSGTWTVPSLMSMITGCYPHQVGVSRWRHPYPAGRPNLMTAFAAADFEVTCFHPYPKLGFINTPGAGRVRDSQKTEQVVAALRGSAGSDRFVLVHYWWTHLPYINRALPISKWRATCDFAIESLGRDARRIAPVLQNSYNKAVTFFSEQVLGRYMEAATAGGQNALVVVTADHGETWGASHPPGYRVNNIYDFHGRWISDETVEVPLIFWGQTGSCKVPAGQRLGGFARGIDLPMTIAELAGIDWPGPRPLTRGPQLVERDHSAHSEVGVEVQGNSLAQHIVHATAVETNSAFTVSTHNTFQPDVYPPDGKRLWRCFGLRTASYWLIWDGVDQSGQAVALPGCAAPDAGETARGLQHLENLRQQSVDPGPVIPIPALHELLGESPLSDSQANSGEREASEQFATVEQQLRGLGYID